MAATIAPTPTPLSGSVPVRASRGLWWDAGRRLIRNKPAIIGLVCIALFVGAAVLASVVAPYDPIAGSLADRLKPPSVAHIMGTDLQGRDEFSRILYGARISLTVGVVAVIAALAMGGIVGALAGGLGGWVDSVAMRVTDVLLAIPGILLAIGIIAWLDRGLPQLMLAIAVTYAPIFARLLRGSLLALRESD
jgi:peptide/nickel transport system permease protein